MLIKGARRLEKIRFFPFYSKADKKGKYIAIIGLGSNIEDEKKRFRSLFRLLMQDKRLQVLQTSPFLINKAFGFEEQKDFTNAVMVVSTSLHARALLKVLFFMSLNSKEKELLKMLLERLIWICCIFQKKRVKMSIAQCLMWG